MQQATNEVSPLTLTPAIHDLIEHDLIELTVLDSLKLPPNPSITLSTVANNPSITTNVNTTSKSFKIPSKINVTPEKHIAAVNEIHKQKTNLKNLDNYNAESKAKADATARKLTQLFYQHIYPNQHLKMLYEKEMEELIRCIHTPMFKEIKFDRLEVTCCEHNPLICRIVKVHHTTIKTGSYHGYRLFTLCEKCLYRRQTFGKSAIGYYHHSI